MIPLVQDFVLVFGVARHAKGDSNQRHARDASHRYDLCSSRQDLCLPGACLLGLADAGPQVSHCKVCQRQPRHMIVLSR